MNCFKNALISVSNKRGLDTFAKYFSKQGMRILSTGGTGQFLRHQGLEVRDISDLTQFEAVMGNRVKTLHPFIYMSLLARDDNSEDLELLKRYQLQAIDLVIVNLYPFHESLHLGEREQVDWIDIGGPTLLRAAAKNYFRITVISNPSDYEWILEKKGDLTQSERKRLAAKAFSHVSSYDSMIAKEWEKSLNKENNNHQNKKNITKKFENHQKEKIEEEFKDEKFSNKGGEFKGGLKEIAFSGSLIQELRYGENPKQKASWYRFEGQKGLQDAKILQGKALSYNNILDLESALKTLFEFRDKLTCVAVKHNNPCGVASGDGGDSDSSISCVPRVIERALKADPMSVFGGVLAINALLEEDSFQVLKSNFLECLIAKDFSKEFLKLMSQSKPNVRLLKWGDEDLLSSFSNQSITSQSFKSLLGGFLVQSLDEVDLKWQNHWDIFGENPDELTKRDLLMAWKISAHLKSNAIALVSKEQTVGLGMGQVNRVDAVEQAINRMKKFHPQAKNVVLASDAFFPFPDSIEKAASEGIRWVIQSGGAKRDEDVKEKTRELKVNMIFTKTRHFLH